MPADAVAVNIPEVTSLNVLHAEARQLAADAHERATKTAEEQTRDLTRRTAAASGSTSSCRATNPKLHGDDWSMVRPSSMNSVSRKY